MMTRCSCIVVCGLLFACSGRGDAPSSHRDASNERPSASVPGSTTVDTVRRYCFQDPGSLRVSEDSVGPLDLRMNLKSLRGVCPSARDTIDAERSEEHTSELQSRLHLVCRLLLEKKKDTLTCLSSTRSLRSQP